MEFNYRKFGMGMIGVPIGLLIALGILAELGDLENPIQLIVMVFLFMTMVNIGLNIEG